jgi:hypothetical protein
MGGIKLPRSTRGFVALLATLVIGQVALAAAPAAAEPICQTFFPSSGLRGEDPTTHVCVEAGEDSEGNLELVFWVDFRGNGVTQQSVILTEDAQGHPSVVYDGYVGALAELHGIFVAWPMQIDGRNTLCYRILDQTEQTCILPR